MTINPKEAIPKKADPKKKDHIILFILVELIVLICFSNCTSKSFPKAKRSDIPVDTTPEVKNLIIQLQSYNTVERENATKEIRSIAENARNKENLLKQSNLKPTVPLLIDEINDFAKPKTYKGYFCMCLNPLSWAYGTGEINPLIDVKVSEGRPPAYHAIIALGFIGDPRAIEPLLRAIKKEDYPFKLEIIEALGQIGDPRGAEPLIKMLRITKITKSPTTSTLVESLEKITGEKLGSDPDKWIAWWEENKDKYIKNQ